MHQELCLGTEIMEFRQALRGRGFSPTWFNSCLRSIQMVEVFGAETAVHSNLKDLRLNGGFLELFSDSPGLSFQGCFWTVRN